jgi:cytochrome d ubiquinol oxidase subunit II
MSLADLWFILIAFFWTGYLVLEGFDFGVGMLLPFLARDEDERGAMLEAIGPLWDGNEVWLIVAGGATFAAFPIWYAGLFSAAFLWLVLVLVALILRAVSFEWGSRSDHPAWRRWWMWCNAGGSLLVPFLWGVALSSMLFGLPFDANEDFAGSALDFLSWYSLLGGATLVVLCLVHGATFLRARADGPVAARAGALAARLAPAAALPAIAFAAATLLVAADVNEQDLLPGIVPAALAALAALAAAVLARRERDGWAFAATAALIALLVVTLFVSLHPRVLVSDPAFANSLTVADASSTETTLRVMTIAAIVFAPLVLAYQAWTFHVFARRTRGRR